MDLNDRQSDASPPSATPRYWAVLADLWIAATILIFFASRIWGSAVVQHALRTLMGR